MTVNLEWARQQEDRYLTDAEKVREVVSFAEYRRDPDNFRTSHEGAHGGEGWIDPEVLPLVDALNGLDGVCTVQSCCGHRWPTNDGYGSESVHHGQLWLRLSENVARAFDEQVGELLREDVIVHVQKLYAYQTATTPHEVFDIQWQDGRMAAAQVVIFDFFDGLDTRSKSTEREVRYGNALERVIGLTTDREPDVEAIQDVANTALLEPAHDFGAAL